MEKQESFRLDADEFNNIVEKAYGGSFEFEAIAEADNALYEFSVPNSAMFFGDDAEKIRSGHYKTFCTHQVFQCLFEDHFLPEGEYIIDNRH